MNTPVALIIFKRPETTKKVFSAIREVKPQKLFVIADGPRSDITEEVAKCQAARSVIDMVDWDCEVITNYSDTNLGCKERVASGLHWVFSLVEEAIILEDDCLPDPSFFRFCEELLERYRNDERIMHISGNNFQFGRKVTEDSYYFSRYNHIWGWATWRRAWQLYDVRMELWPKLRDSNWLLGLLKDSKAAQFWEFGFEASYQGWLKTWDLAWTFTCWVHNGLSIIPEKNLVANIGINSEATFTKKEIPQHSLDLDPPKMEKIIFPLVHPSAMIRNDAADMFTEQMIFSGPGPDMKKKTESSDRELAKAIAALNSNENSEALQILESAIAAAPEMPGLYYGRAIAQARLGLTSEAIASLQQLLLAIPEHEKGRQLLAELGQASAQAVETLLQQAIELYRAGKNVPALRLAEKAYSLGKFVPGLHYFRSVCLASVGRYEEALKAAQEEVAQNPEHPEAQQRVEELTRAIVKPKREKIPTDKRPWNTSLPHDLMMSIQNALHNYSYKGVPLQKNPFDFAIYPILIWNLKPRTIIEIGSKSGGSALWFGDLMNNFGIDGHVYSLDIVKVTNVPHPRVTFIEGDGRDLAASFSEKFLKTLPRPLLVIEDADHSYQTSKSVLDFFHPYLQPNEYIIIEDGIISDIIKDDSYNSGPHQALKLFLSEHQGEYEIDGEYCDFFGYNLTWGTNGYLKKLAKSTPAMATKAQNEAPVAGIDDREFQDLIRTLRPYAKLSEVGLYSLFSLAKHICQENITGNFVVCGSTAVSSAALMAAVVNKYTKQPRWVYAFTAIPPQDIQQEEFLSLMSNFRVGDIVRTIQGTTDILPRLSNALGMIACLDIADQDYESTKAILENLYDRVSNDGIIQVDDYGAWEGCRQAVHEFEASRQLKFDIQQIDYTGIWFSCPDKFPVNPTLDAALLRDFAADDPVAYGIQSQMSCNERFQLYYTLRQLLPKSTFPLRFVEIGSFAGSSLFLICQALKRIAPQLQGYAIDPGGHPQLQRVLEHLKNEVTHLQMFSHQALPQLQRIFEQEGAPPFMFIDGDHSYEGVRQDILNYYPLLAPGGMMLFHDYLPPLNAENQEAILFHHGGKEPGIRQACEELMENTYGCELVDLPLLYPTDPTQTQAHLPIIPGVFSTIRAYRKPQN